MAKKQKPLRRSRPRAKIPAPVPVVIKDHPGTVVHVAVPIGIEPVVHHDPVKGVVTLTWFEYLFGKNKTIAKR